MSSLLETFMVMFESDSDEVKVGADKAESAVDKLDKKITEADQSSVVLGKNLLKLAGAAVVAIGGIVGSVGLLAGAISQAGVLNELDKTSTALGVSATEWDLWARSADEAGHKVEGLKNTLRNLRNVDGVGDDPFEFLLDAAKRMEGMSADKRKDLATSLGIDADTFLMLQRGRGAIEDMIKRQRELGTVTEKQILIARKFNDAKEKGRTSFRMLTTTLSEYVLPVLTKFIELFGFGARLIKSEGRLIAATIGVVALAITAKLAPALVAAAWQFAKIPVMAFLASASMIGFSGAMGLVAASVWAALWPILAIGAAIGLAILVFDDLWAFFTGAPSVIGGMVDAFKGAVPAIKQTFREWGEFAIDMIKKVFELWLKGANMLTFGMAGKAIDGFGNAAGWVRGQFATPEVESAQAMMNTANGTPIGALSSAAIAAGGSKTQENNVTIGEITIETQATDAQGISAEVGSRLENELSRTASGFDDGVAG